MDSRFRGNDEQASITYAILNKKPVTPFGQQLRNFSGECDTFAQVPKNIGNESVRIVIPRAVSLLYTLRNKRGIGHVGGDVDANAIDGITIARVADWVICELIRIFHGMSLEEADALVGSLASRSIPDVWEVAGRKRVLRSDLDFKQTLCAAAQIKASLSDAASESDARTLVVQKRVLSFHAGKGRKPYDYRMKIYEGRKEHSVISALSSYFEDLFSRGQPV